MGATELTALLPLMIAGAVPVVLILAIAVRRSEDWTLGLSLAGYLLVLAALVATRALAPMQVTPLLQIDGLARVFMALAALAGAASALLARNDPSCREAEREEVYVLLSLAVLGACVLGASRHLASLFLGLELMSLSLFPLIAHARRRPEALEAGIKYLVISGVATGLLLFGMALLYAGLGGLDFATLGQALAGQRTPPVWILGGLALLLAGLAMKLSLAPLHWWTPDVYQGAPAVVTGFLASAAKGAVILVLLRLLAASGAHQQTALIAVLAGLAVLSMLVGNLLALMQRNVRRLLAYSSIAHMGYLLVALLAAGALGVEAVILYLAAYFVSTLGAFGAVALKGPGGDELSAYQGLYQRRPWLAVTLTLMLLSLAGIPLTAGFIGKFYLFTVGVDAALWIPVGVLVVGSVIGLFYYLRLIFVLYSPSDVATIAPRVQIAGAAALLILTLALIGIGVWPEPVIALIRSAIGTAFS